MRSSSLLAYYDISLEKFNILLGIVLNVLLLFLIRTSSGSYLGNYKYLLGLFAIIDVYLCLIHGLLNPIVIVIGPTMGACLYAPWQSQMLSAVYYTCFSVPFTLMNIHFLYRYWSVAHPARIALFSKPYFIALICLYPLIQCGIWFMDAWSIYTNANDKRLTEVISVFAESYSEPVYDGWMLMDHWHEGTLNAPALYVVIKSNIIMFGSLSIAVTLATLTYRTILMISKGTTLSKSIISIQYTLLVAVCAQTLIPLICVYIPYFLVITCPFLKIPGKFHNLANNFSLFVSIFPAWDAIVIIMLIKDYRVGMAKILGLNKEPKVGPILQTQFTTSMQS